MCQLGTINFKQFLDKCNQWTAIFGKFLVLKNIGNTIIATETNQ
jgi:hypothetical protein